MERNCKECNKKLIYSQRQFCSHNCRQEHDYKINVDNWLSGKTPGCKGKTKQLCSYVRRYLHETRGTACERCGWDERHPIDGAVLTEIEHIDGNAENNVLSNLKVLCPNCHSMTPTFRARNKNSTRERS